MGIHAVVLHDAPDVTSNDDIVPDSKNSCVIHPRSCSLSGEAEAARVRKINLAQTSTRAAVY